MAPLGPFEPAPVLAVAVSGGADSMALALLAATWAHRRGGAVHALTVDHGLRPEARGEAVKVARWLRRRGLRCHRLRWADPVTGTGVQAAARAARYRLLTDWCRRHGVPHLLTAHQRDDQAETVLMRLARHSGLDGLAGMPALTALHGVRLLRPLLAVPGGRLRAGLRRRRQPWLEDPSNADPRFARVRARATLRALDDDARGDGALDSAAFLALARHAARARTARAERTAADAAAAVRLSPAGYALLDAAWWRDATAAARRDLLSALLLTVGAGAYPPRGARLARLLAAFGDGDWQTRTLAGCRLAGWRGDLLVCREAGRMPQKTGISPGEGLRWDRFEVRLGRWPRGHAGGPRAPALAVGGLGPAGWRQVRDLVAVAPPAAVRSGLPALWQNDRILMVPHLGLCVPVKGLLLPRFSTIFAPAHPLVPVQRRVV